jgi:hypothetical protein
MRYRTKRKLIIAAEGREARGDAADTSGQKAAQDS